MANTLSCSIVGCQLDYGNALLYDMTQKTSIVCKEYRTVSPDLCVIHHIVVHPRHYSNSCIGYQSSNVLVQTRHNEVQSSTTPAANLPSPAHWSASTFRSQRSLNSVLLTVPFTKTVTAAWAFHISTPTVWNSLPFVVRQTSSHPQFLCRLKGHLFQRAFDRPWLPSASVLCP